MKALILGCSHAAGSEMEKDVDAFGRTHSFPALIARHLGYEPDNCAIPGGSNDAMFRIFTEHLDQLTTDDIVIACWSGANRTEIKHEIDQCWLPFIPGRPFSDKISLDQEYLDYHKSWSRYHYNTTSGELNKIKNIQALNAIAHVHGIHVINIDSFWPVSNVDNIKWAFDQPFFEWAIKNNHPKTDYGHFFLSTHQAYADLVISCLTAHPDAVQRFKPVCV